MQKPRKMKGRTRNRTQSGQERSVPPVGLTIEIEEELGLSEGVRVSIVIEDAQSTQNKWGEGLRRCAGALVDDWTEADDRILDEIHQSRHSDSRREIL
jgi:hypothetical protein